MMCGGPAGGYGSGSGSGSYGMVKVWTLAVTVTGSLRMLMLDGVGVIERYRPTTPRARSSSGHRDPRGQLTIHKGSAVCGRSVWLLVCRPRVRQPAARAPADQQPPVAGRGRREARDGSVHLVGHRPSA